MVGTSAGAYRLVNTMPVGRAASVNVFLDASFAVPEGRVLEEARGCDAQAHLQTCTGGTSHGDSRGSVLRIIYKGFVERQKRETVD
ncbi:hypothetical protein D3C77_145320 [compost metagenome]